MTLLLTSAGPAAVLQLTPLTALQTTVDTDTFHPRNETDCAQTAEEAIATAGGGPLLLPAADPNNTNGLHLGESISLDQFGPVVGAPSGLCSEHSKVFIRLEI